MCVSSFFLNLLFIGVSDTCLKFYSVNCSAKFSEMCDNAGPSINHPVAGTDHCGVRKADKRNHDHAIWWNGADRPKATNAPVTEKPRPLVRLNYSRSPRSSTWDERTITRFLLGTSGIGLTVQVQLRCPFLSKIQAAPPRFQISIRH